MVIKHTHHLLQIVFAILVGYLLVTRLFVSWVQYAPEQFIESVEWATSSEISFEKIEVQQNWLGFQFQVQKLAVQDQAFDLQIQHLDMDVNLFSMLVPTLKFGDYVTIQQGVYHHKKSQEESLSSSEEGLTANYIDRLTDINLDISQLWQRVKVSDVIFNALFDPNLTLHLYDYQSLKGAQLNVSAEFGVAYKQSLNFERFGFKSSFDINLLGQIDHGELSLFSFHPLRVEAIGQLLPVVWHEKLPKGELILDLHAQISKSAITKLTLNLNAQSLKWSQPRQALPKHLGLELVWESYLQNRQSDFKSWHFRLSNIQINNQYIQAVSPIELNFEANQFLMFRTDNFDIEPFKVFVKSFVPYSEISALFDKTSELAIEKVNGQFNWETFRLPQLEMTIKQLTLPVTDYPGIELHRLVLSKKHNKLILATDNPMILSGLNLPKGGVKIELPNEIQLKHSPSEAAWVLNPLNFTIDKMPLTLTAKASTKGDVDAKLTIAVGTMQTLKQYLPYSLFSPELQSWLKMALVDGKNIKAHVRLKGLLENFPFQDGSGVFDINATVDHAFIKFDSDWPILQDFSGQIQFTPYQLKVSSPRIHVGANAYAQGVEVVIDRLDQEDIALVFKGKVQTQLNNAMSYLNRSPLVDLLSMEDFIQNTQFSGAADITLDRIWIPLAGYDKQVATVSGRVLFKESSMILSDNISLKKIKGALAFTEKGVSASKISAKTFNHDSLFSVQTKPQDNTILIQGTGQFLPSKNPYFDAPVPWRLGIHIPLVEEDTSGMDIQLDVPLDQVNSLLPAPFDPKALGGKTLKVNIGLAQKMATVRVDLPGVLAVKGLWKSVKNRDQIQQLRVLLGDKAKSGFKTEESQSYIQGSIGEVNLDDWINYAPHLPLDQILQGESVALSWKVSKIDVDSLTFSDHIYPNVRIEWLKRNLKTTLQIKSSNVLANVIIKPNAPMELNVERLRLHAIESNTRSDHSNVHAETLCQPEGTLATLWPEIIFKGKKIELNGYLVDSLNFHLLDANERLTISDLQGSFGQGSGRLTGQYLFDKKRHKSTLSLSLKSKKVAELLRFIQIKQGFTGKKANVDAQLSWQGALECFSVKAATGQLNFKLKEGVIEDIEPGFARLIGLLSVESLARRLSLDLKDVTNKGMVYDEIKGQAQLKFGILELESFGLKAPSASVALFGQVNLLEETFKLKAYVTPAIGATIPTIAALAGYANPLAALAVYTFMKVVPGINENLVTFRYNVTGPWADPIVSDVESKPKNSVPLFDTEHSILDTQQ